MNKEQEKILDVKNLRISFKTNTGTVKAVRGIDFSLYRGRTLAIVGESGSGKSVTSKAILGILANNKIIEDGEIIYDGKNLLTLSEDKFTKIRGVKISMIFQDPLSALNPIMKVGKQLTEAMYLDSKAQRKAAKKYILATSKVLAKYATSEEEKAILKALNTENVTDESKNSIISKAVVEENNNYLSSINAAKEVIANFEANCLINEEALANSFLANLKQVAMALKACNDVFSNESDDLVDVYASLMHDYFKSYNDSVSYQKHLGAILQENNAEDIFDVEAKIRIKEKEVVTPKESYFNSMVKLTKSILKHFDEILEKRASVSEKNIEDVIKLFERMYVQQYKSLTKEETKARAIELMREVGIPEPERRFYQYPFEFSGGMRQRIVIAIALSGNPEILICDEPTTALDVTIQAQILELINKLKEEKNLSIIFITHDLGVVANMANDIAVMYAGKIVEYGSVYDIFYDPRHPYTWALLGSMPDLNTKGKLDAIPGTPPNMLLPPRGDAFAARNSYAIALDYKQEPPFFKISETHYAKTWLAHQSAPDVEAPKTVVARIKNSLANNPANFPTYELKKNSILESIKGGKK